MPKGSQELTNARRQEIIDACAALYETHSFKEISILEIGRATSFARTSIYNYFQTKEEIFLALLQQEYERWCADLETLRQAGPQTQDAFAAALAQTLEKRPRLLKLLSMNHYDMEENSRMERLVDFKRVYGQAMDAVRACLVQAFPQMSEAGRETFIFAFFPFLFGVYPYTVVTEKQRAAMEQAGVHYRYLTIGEIITAEVRNLLAGCAQT